MSKLVCKKILTSAVVLACMVGAPSVARANRYGELHITKSTKLTDDQFGSVVFDASNITLDCNGYQVHTSSHTKTNCYGRKCGIFAKARSNITIKNCRVVGYFDTGVMLDGTTNAIVRNVDVYGAGYGLDAWRNTGLQVSDFYSEGNASEGVMAYEDVGGSFQSIEIDGAGSGMSIHYSQGTSVWALWAFNTRVGLGNGFSINYSSDITAEDVYSAFGDARGIQVFDSDRVSLSDSEVYENTDTGIYVDQTVDSFFLDNVSDGNSCDAEQGPAVYNTGNTWSGNDFGSICGTVPSNH